MSLAKNMREITENAIRKSKEFDYEEFLEEYADMIDLLNKTIARRAGEKSYNAVIDIPFYCHSDFWNYYQQNGFDVDSVDSFAKQGVIMSRLKISWHNDFK